MKILLACPVSEYKRYILFQWLDYVLSLKKQDFEVDKSQFNEFVKFDVLLVDNSPKEAFHREIKAYYPGVYVVRRKPYENETLAETMAECNNIISRYVLRNNYDYLFSLECDVFPPPAILSRLLAYNKPVISALYNIGHYPERRLMVQCLEEVSPREMQIRNLTTKESLLFVNGQCKQVFNAGLGCTLISRDVLHGYQFHAEPESGVHADTHFGYDLFNRGIPWMVDTSLICKHFNSDWNLIRQTHARKH